MADGFHQRRIIRCVTVSRRVGAFDQLAPEDLGRLGLPEALPRYGALNSPIRPGSLERPVDRPRQNRRAGFGGLADDRIHGFLGNARANRVVDAHQFGGVRQPLQGIADGPRSGLAPDCQAHPPRVQFLPESLPGKVHVLS